jgi:hypothetical protein
VALSNEVKGAERFSTSRNVIVIQDRFPGSNFAHFLFDWVTRIGLLCDSRLIEIKDCIFALGGVPGAFELMMLSALSAEYGISDDQFLFPSKGMVVQTNKRVFWFSDQSEAYLHPAQMAHPQSVAIVRRIADKLKTDFSCRFRRIYISRMDANRRRVANESEVMGALVKLGFEPLILSALPLRDQFSIVAGAEHIVGPHGMGLTLASLNPGAPALIELHHPNKGTDAYALMAAAMRFSYQPVVGVRASGEMDDFLVPLEGVLAAIGQLDTLRRSASPASPVGPSIIEPVPGMPVGGRELSMAEIDAIGLSAPPASSSVGVTRHERGDPQLAPDSNVGAWTTIRLDEGRLYTAYCWIWIPRDFQGSSVELHIGEWPKQKRHIADIDLRGQWQLISATRNCPIGITNCAVVLRLACPKGDYVFSAGWKIETGLGPSSRSPPPATPAISKREAGFERLAIGR